MEQGPQWSDSDLEALNKLIQQRMDGTISDQEYEAERLKLTAKYEKQLAQQREKFLEEQKELQMKRLREKQQQRNLVNEEVCCWECD